MSKTMCQISPGTPSRDGAPRAPNPTKRTVRKQSNRRQFLYSGAVLGAAVALDSLQFSSAEEQTQDEEPSSRHAPLDVVRVGVVGIGGRGACASISRMKQRQHVV